ncbi:phage virion morphogenesis protein [Escherichia coli]|nr:phage virion morphogenesis protein [Escherichia coli]
MNRPEDPLCLQLNTALDALLAAAKPAWRRAMARKMARTIQLLQQKHLRRQTSPEGEPFTPRRRAVKQTQQGIRFLWRGEIRSLKNWRLSGRRGNQTITGYDTDRNAVRTFYRRDIERCVEINRARKRQYRKRDHQMFRKLRTARLLKARADSNRAEVGFEGRTAEIARIHHYGLTGDLNSLVKVRYPKRELLGLSPHERAGLIEDIYHDLLELL